MAQFYKELKELRESRGILLEEISDRTKINIQILQGIESGDFGEIEIPYLRLFLRAYAEEIGGDSARALEQLDSFLGTGPSPVQAMSATFNLPKDEHESNRNKTDRQSNSNEKLRQDLIKGGVLLVVFVFAILIFQKIFQEESSARISPDGHSIQIQHYALTNQDLNTNFILVQSNEQILNVTPPFYFKLKTTKQIAYTFKNDTLPTLASTLEANRERDLGVFVNTSEILFNHTNGLTVFVNGINIISISNYNHPLRLTIRPSPPSMVIQRYKPLQ